MSSVILALARLSIVDPSGLRAGVRTSLPDPASVCAPMHHQPTTHAAHMKGEEHMHTVIGVILAAATVPEALERMEAYIDSVAHGVSDTPMTNQNDNAPTGLPSEAELDEMGDNELDKLCDEVSEARDRNPDGPVVKANWDRLRTYIERRWKE